MPFDDRNKLNRLEELKRKLYNKSYRTHIEHRDVFSVREKGNVVDAWGDKENPLPTKREKILMKTSVFKKFFVFSVIVFFLALGYAGYEFMMGGNTVSNNNIDMSIIGNNFTAGGDKLSLVVSITNRNNAVLQSSDVVMQYSQDSSSNASSNVETVRQTIGDVQAGAVVNESFNPVLFGQQGSTATITFSLEYRVAGSNAVFLKTKTYDVTINSTPVNLSVDSPDSISPNQNMTLVVKATLNSTNPVQNGLIRVDYPAGFQFASAIPAPSFSNNEWNVGDLAPGVEHDITITGKMIGVFDGDQKTFNVSVGSQSGTDKSVIGVVLNSIQQILLIKKPFLGATLSINGISQSQYAVDSSTPVNVNIQYTNNLDTVVDNLKVVAKLSGNAFDPSTVLATQGYYDSSTNTITWDKSSLSGLAEVNSGESGLVSFSFSPLSLFSASGGILSNPSINIEVDVSGDQSGTGFTTSTLTNSSSAAILISSDVGFSNKALYYSGAFNNTGAIPPKVGQVTTYDVVWSLSNTANNISNAAVTATLPAWVDFAGKFSPSSENLTYDPTSRQITWNVGQIQRGAGITGAARSVSFQISFTPSISQVGTTPIILNSAVLTGHDDFANVDINVNKASLSTILDSDTAFPNGGGIVQN